MQAFLILAGLSVIAMVALAFLIASLFEAPAPRVHAGLPVELPPNRFFAADARTPLLSDEQFRLHVERHVRLEHAAAESFVYAPTVESLHSRSISTLVH